MGQPHISEPQLLDPGPQESLKYSDPSSPLFLIVLDMTWGQVWPCTVCSDVVCAPERTWCLILSFSFPQASHPLDKASSGGRRIVTHLKIKVQMSCFFVVQ